MHTMSILNIDSGTIVPLKADNSVVLSILAIISERNITQLHA
jgi:hypothetical protein